MKRPNIVFFLSDDQGAWAMRCAGNGDVITPNLDALAADGVRFENFFCVSPVCSPARASILTGTIPSKHGVHDWLSGGNLSPSVEGFDPKYHASEYGAVDYTGSLTGISDLLAGAGYRCALSGKWHMGDSVRPQHGYTDWFTIGRGGCAYYDADVVRNGRIEVENRYITDVIAENALETLEKLTEDDRPFLLSVHFTSPHSPWDAANHPDEYLHMYDGCAFTATPDLPLHPWQVPTAPRGTGEKRKELLRGYYAAITAMDAQVGRIVDKLREKGILDDTLVVFSGDNGMNLGQHGIWGKGNGTFPQNMFDTSVKVPFILRYPKALPRGAVETGLASHYDLMPTLIDWLALTGEVKQPLPGKSILPILKGADDADREVVVFDEYGPTRMIRNREWKFVHRYPFGPDELYHVSEDPDETKNWVNCPEYADVQAELHRKLDAFFVRYADPEVDGSREPVTGYGQNGPAGVRSKGINPYRRGDNTDRWIPR